MIKNSKSIVYIRSINNKTNNNRIVNTAFAILRGGSLTTSYTTRISHPPCPTNSPVAVTFVSSSGVDADLGPFMASAVVLLLLLLPFLQRLVTCCCCCCSGMLALATQGDPWRCNMYQRTWWLTRQINGLSSRLLCISLCVRCFQVKNRSHLCPVPSNVRTAELDSADRANSTLSAVTGTCLDFYREKGNIKPPVFPLRHASPILSGGQYSQSERPRRVLLLLF